VTGPIRRRSPTPEAARPSCRILIVSGCPERVHPEPERRVEGHEGLLRNHRRAAASAGRSLSGHTSSGGVAPGPLVFAGESVRAPPSCSMGRLQHTSTPSPSTVTLTSCPHR
jgi:hypothetical protein